LQFHINIGARNVGYYLFTIWTLILKKGRFNVYFQKTLTLNLPLNTVNSIVLRVLCSDKRVNRIVNIIGEIEFKKLQARFIGSFIG